MGRCLGRPQIQRKHHLAMDQPDQVRWSGGKMSISAFNEEVDDLKEDADELKKKKKQKKPPSVSEVRKEMKKMIFFYEKSIAASIPTVYPLLGAVGEHMDDKTKKGGKSTASAKSGSNKRKRNE
jgi:sugar-specific transcriptional regulator TrmB